MPTQPSFTKYYWITWILTLAAWLLSSLRMPLSESFGWFALVTGLGSSYVFHFEFGRLMGFLKAHCPEQHEYLQGKRFLAGLAFIHPTLFSRAWQPSRQSQQLEESAFSTYRSAWFFSLVTVGALLVLANTVL